MPFIQIIEYRTSKPDEMKALGEEWEKLTEGKRTATGVLVAQDRDNPDRYFNIVTFDSYEAAMENSNLPETQGMAEKFAAVCDGPMTFYNLDVIDES